MVYGGEVNRNVGDLKLTFMVEFCIKEIAASWKLCDTHNRN